MVESRKTRSKKELTIMPVPLGEVVYSRDQMRDEFMYRRVISELYRSAQTGRIILSDDQLLHLSLTLWENTTYSNDEWREVSHDSWHPRNRPQDPGEIVYRMPHTKSRKEQRRELGFMKKGLR